MINRKKKALSLLLAVVMLFTIWMMPNGKAYVDAASLTGKQRALRAYKEFLSKPTIPIIPVGRRYYNLDRCLMEYYSATPSSQVRFSLAYINNDNIPELIVERMEECWRHGLYGVFTYKNGKVTRLRSGGGEDYYIGCYVNEREKGHSHKWAHLYALYFVLEENEEFALKDTLEELEEEEKEIELQIHANSVNDAPELIGSNIRSFSKKTHTQETIDMMFPEGMDDGFSLPED